MQAAPVQIVIHVYKLVQFLHLIYMCIYSVACLLFITSPLLSWAKQNQLNFSDHASEYSYIHMYSDIFIAVRLIVHWMVPKCNTWWWIASYCDFFVCCIILATPSILQFTFLYIIHSLDCFIVTYIDTRMVWTRIRTCIVGFHANIETECGCRWWCLCPVNVLIKTNAQKLNNKPVRSVILAAT